VRCAESLRVQAYFDAEVDALSAADIERHLEHCAECRALLRDLEQVRTVLRRDSDYARAPTELRSKIMRALDQEGAAEIQVAEGAPASEEAAAPVWTATPEGTAAPQGTAFPMRTPRPRERVSPSWRMRPFWMGALGGVGGTAIAATFAFLLFIPRFANPLLDQLVSAHVRSLMPSHLIDVVSTDKHTVKPWFTGHADVSPAVADFEPQGYRLIGGRVDYLDHQRSAVVVYQHGAHVINVFSWAGRERALPADATRSGYHFAFWKAGDLDYCAVSDTGWDELLGLERLLRD
jgi:anti-sigma factor (TIGR02949 family)